MADVIDRMVEAMLDNCAQGTDDELRPHVIAALRAVKDTHRLVPVEPTQEMQNAIDDHFEDFGPGAMWYQTIGSAPDYTEDTDG